MFRAGHRAGGPHDSDVLLIDIDPPSLAGRFDVPLFPHRHVIDHYKSAGAKVVLYPHGARPELYYDGLFDPYEPVDARLVHAVGYGEFLRRVNCPGEVHVIGWSLCDPAPFVSRPDVRRVLFAPLHPTAGDTLVEPAREANVSIYERLLACGWELTVRTLGTPEQNGLWAVDGVTFVPGGMDLGLADIHAADAVVAGAGTFPALAIARGVPTVIYHHVGPAMYGLPGEVATELRHPDRYADYIRYPFGAEAGPLDEVVYAAARSEQSIAAWRRRFIGEPFDPATAVATLERVARGEARPPSLDARGFMVLALADEILERPELLVRYASRFGPDDDVTLVLWAPGLGEPQAEEMARAAIRAGGTNGSSLTHWMAFAQANSQEAERYLAGRAHALLSEWPAVGTLARLPRFGAADVDGLWSLASRGQDPRPPS